MQLRQSVFIKEWRHAGKEKTNICLLELNIEKLEEVAIIFSNLYVRHELMSPLSYLPKLYGMFYMVQHGECLSKNNLQYPSTIENLSFLICDRIIILTSITFQMMKKNVSILFAFPSIPLKFTVFKLARQRKKTYALLIQTRTFRETE